MKEAQSASEPNPGLLFPYSITDVSMVSGATFLFFKRPIMMTLPPLVITEGSYDLFPLIRERRPEWAATFLGLFETWREQHKGWERSLRTLEPLRSASIKVLWLSYPADSRALERSEMLATSTGMSLDGLADLINPYTAAGEIIRHIMLEAFLEHDEDIERLFNYCSGLFGSEPPSHILAKGYLLRLQLLEAMRDAAILLTNERLVSFIEQLPVQSTADSYEAIEDDVIAWEFFRQILSQRIDPLNESRARLVVRLLRRRSGEIQRLRSKCFSLASQVRRPSTLKRLPKEVESIVRSEVETEVADLLNLDRETVREFFRDLFSDQKTWLAVCAFISGVVSGQFYIQTAGAMGALSSVGAKAFKAAANRGKKLQQSDYRLVYSLTRKA